MNLKQEKAQWTQIGQKIAPHPTTGNFIKNYQQEVERMFEKVRFAAPVWHNPVMYPDEAPESNPLVILVASQKGYVATSILVF